MIPIDFQPSTEDEHRKCLLDAGWCINNHFTITDEGGSRVKFKQKPVQRRVFLEQHGCDVYLKSRQHGLTTEKTMEMLEECQRVPDLICGIIAHTKMAAQEIFATRIRSVYEKQPQWVRDNNPAIELDKTHIKFTNGSSIHVAVSFQSATIHRLHISEYGPLCAKFPARAAQLKGDTLPAVHPQKGGRISVESTAEGPAGDFYELCIKARADTIKSELTGIPLNVKQYRFHFFAWFEDEKNSIDPKGFDIPQKMREYFAELKNVHKIDLTEGQKTWYYFTKDGANGLGKKMKQQHPSTIDEAFEQAVDGAVYPEEMLDMHDSGYIGNFPYVKRHPVFTFWDLGISKGNATCVIFVQFIKDEIRIIDYYECEGRGMTFHAAQVLAKPYTWPINDDFCFLPHDAANRDKITAVPLLDSAEELGLRVHQVIRPQNKDKDGIEAVRGIFPNLRINLMAPEDDHQLGDPYHGTDRLIKALSYYRYSWDEDKKIWSKTPIHDWASNPADALQTLALGYKYCPIGGDYLGDDEAVAAYISQREGIDDVEVIDPMDFV